VVRPLDLHEAGSYGVAGPLCGQIAARPQDLAEQDIRDTWALTEALAGDGDTVPPPGPPDCIINAVIAGDTAVVR
jgi:hypothetical protein